MSRISRVALQIQQTLSTLIQLELKDPRIKLITVSKVKLSNDMNHAKIYISTLGDITNIQKTVEILNGAASGYLRHSLAKSLQLRVTPALRFYADESFIYSQKIAEQLLQQHSDDKPTDNSDDE
jgi:ribosome-binding factor A